MKIIGMNVTSIDGEKKESRDFVNKSTIELHIRTSTPVNEEFVPAENLDDISDVSMDVLAEEGIVKTYCDQGCQAEIFIQSESVRFEKTFICDRYLYESGKCEASVQTDVYLNSKIIEVTPKKLKSVKCGPDTKNMEDVAVGTNDELPAIRSFTGFLSIEDEGQLLDLAGVTFDNFQILLDAMETKHTWKISKEDRLLMFLVKLKFGVTYAALSVLFSVHRTTASVIFVNVLLNLAAATEHLVHWPDKYVVQATMPECFKEEYSDTRVIIDCTEFRIECPSKHEDTVWCYSHYKHGFTAKVLIMMTPGGLYNIHYNS